MASIMHDETRSTTEPLATRAAAGVDPGVILMRNTPAVRAFWRAVKATLEDAKVMAQVCTLPAAATLLLPE